MIDTKFPLMCKKFKLQCVQILKPALFIKTFLTLLFELLIRTVGVPCLKWSSSVLILDDVMQQGNSLSLTGTDFSAASCHNSQCLERSLILLQVDSLTLADLLGVSPNQWLLSFTELMTCCLTFGCSALSYWIYSN